MRAFFEIDDAIFILPLQWLLKTALPKKDWKTPNYSEKRFFMVLILNFVPHENRT